MSPPPPVRRGLPRWVRRPALSIGLLAAAVTVSVARGQPPPAGRASGVTVPVRSDSPATVLVGTLLVVTPDGGVIRFDTETRQISPLPLPPALTALRAWSVDDVDVVLGQLPDGETEAYAVPLDQLPERLGPADEVVPSADGQTVWLQQDGVATRRVLRAGQRQVSVPLPRAARLVADTRYGLVVTTGSIPDPSASAAASPPATPTASPPPTMSDGPAPPAPAPVATTRRVGRPPPPTRQAPIVAPDAGQPDGAATVPLTTLLVGSRGQTRLLAAAAGLAATADIALVRRPEGLGVVSLHSLVGPRWLPSLSAVSVTGPGQLSPDGSTFAVIARQHQHVRLMVGPTSATTDDDVNVVALDGGPPAAAATPPAFSAAGRVIAVRPDGKVVYYVPRDPRGILLGDDLPPARAVRQG